MRNEKIEEKLALFQTELEAWATREELLQAGERIILSYVIRKEGSEALLDLPIGEFFTFARITSAGARPGVATRVVHFFRDWAIDDYRKVDITTVRELVAYEGNELLLKRVHNCGNLSVAAIAKTLEHEGLPVPEDLKLIAEKFFRP